jgi:hypothetical protein
MQAIDSVTLAPAPIPAAPADTFAIPTVETEPGPLSKRIRHGWILEVLGVAAWCFAYETVRNLVMGTAADAMRNAKTLTVIEKFIGIYHERAVQQFFTRWPEVIAFWNFYYDTAHFFVPLGIAIYLYVKFPARYVLMRNTFFILLLGVAQLAWLAFPITPPKFMPEKYGFVDTQVEYFNIGPQMPLAYGADGEPTEEMVSAVGNLYGGLPSHHVSWAMFSVLALWPVVRRKWVRALLLGHLVLTVGAITVTGNHRFIDFAGSAVEVAIAYGLALLLGRALAGRRRRRALALT